MRFDLIFFFFLHGVAVGLPLNGGVVELLAGFSIFSVSKLEIIGKADDGK